MPYIVTMQRPSYEQMTFEDVIFGMKEAPKMISSNITNTRTYYTSFITEKYVWQFDIPAMVLWLQKFCERHKELYEVPRESLYTKFFIPKRSGGLREINAPHTELEDALKELKNFFELEMHALYHTSAFAYVRGRSTIDAIKRHQMNESKWFLKTDFSNFFGSTTPEFVERQLRQLFPFSEVYRLKAGEAAMRKALDLAFLNDGLPMGTVLSPSLTNWIMIPIDYQLTKALRKVRIGDYEEHLIYTRYADDMQISCRYKFDYTQVIKLINDILDKNHAPFKIKDEKTRFGSSSGSNWNLGLMLNKDNQITIGNKVKKRFRAMVFNFLMDKKNGKEWELHDIQVLLGLYNYYHMVEAEYIDHLLQEIQKRTGLDPIKEIKKSLSGETEHGAAFDPMEDVTVSPEDTPW